MWTGVVAGGPRTIFKACEGARECQPREHAPAAASSPRVLLGFRVWRGKQKRRLGEAATRWAATSTWTDIHRHWAQLDTDQRGIVEHTALEDT